MQWWWETWTCMSGCAGCLPRAVLCLRAQQKEPPAQHCTALRCAAVMLECWSGCAGGGIPSAAAGLRLTAHTSLPAPHPRAVPPASAPSPCCCCCCCSSSSLLAAAAHHHLLPSHPSPCIIIMLFLPADLHLVWVRAARGPQPHQGGSLHERAGPHSHPRSPVSGQQGNGRSAGIVMCVRFSSRGHGSQTCAPLCVMYTLHAELQSP